MWDQYYVLNVKNIHEYGLLPENNEAFMAVGQ